jgi:hypothetical protein
VSRRRGEGRKRIARLEAELDDLRALVIRQATDPQGTASSITDAMAAARLADDLPPGITSVTELMSADEHRAAFTELWDTPSVALTEAEHDEFDRLCGRFDRLRGQQ